MTEIKSVVLDLSTSLKINYSRNTFEKIFTMSSTYSVS